MQVEELELQGAFEHELKVTSVVDLFDHGERLDELGDPAFLVELGHSSDVNMHCADLESSFERLDLDFGGAMESSMDLLDLV